MLGHFSNFQETFAVSGASISVFLWTLILDSIAQGAAGIADLSQCHPVVIPRIFKVLCQCHCGHLSLAKLISDSLCPLPANETSAAHMK